MSARAAIYLDLNASAPLHPRVAEALLPLFFPSNPQISSLIANPSSIHSHGQQAKRWVSDAREKVARALGSLTDSEQLVFTSSGTEANQLAVRSVLGASLRRGTRAHWILTPVEHDSTLQMVKWLEAEGGSVSYLPVDSDGRPEVHALASLWRPETQLVSAVWVNNETGVITDLEALTKEVGRQGGLLHIDAAQAWGKLPIDVDSSGAQLMTFSAHKIGGLAGTGVLWVKRGTPVHSIILGKQEKGRRGGTENVVGIIALGAAASALSPAGPKSSASPLRDQLQHAICERIPGTVVNGGGAPRVGQTLNLSFDGVEGDGLVMALDLAGYSVSSGSACSSGVLEPSHVLLALGRTREQAMAAVRISISETVTWEMLTGFVEVLEKTVARVRAARRE